METRNEKLLSGISPSHQIGIEIGPLTNPIVTPEMGKIRYVDHTTTESLRVKYSDDSHVDTSKIVNVDYVWGEKTLFELTKEEAPFDYVVASHVIEHVPDFIGWLNEIRSILKPGGILSLAIPDHRRCFDYNRQLTRSADVIEAYLLRRKQPSPRQIFDQHASSVSFQGNIVWSGPVDTTELVPIRSMVDALNIATTSIAENSYCDVHCWVFTPLSFFRLLEELSALNLVTYEVAQFHNTEGCEFLVSLRATESSQPTKIKKLADQLTQEIEQEDLNAERATEAVFNLKKEPLEQEIKELQQQIQAMESSKFWKMRKMWFRFKQIMGSN